jgi:biotin transporter BioY
MFQLAGTVFLVVMGFAWMIRGTQTAKERNQKVGSIIVVWGIYILLVLAVLLWTQKHHPLNRVEIMGQQ